MATNDLITTTVEDQRAYLVTQWLTALKDHEAANSRLDEASKRLETAENDIGYQVVPEMAKLNEQFNFWHQDKLYTAWLCDRDPYGQRTYKVCHYEDRPKLKKEVG